MQKQKTSQKLSVIEEHIGLRAAGDRLRATRDYG